MEAKGKVLLKATGIIMIILSIFGLLGGIILAGVSAIFFSGTIQISELLSAIPQFTEAQINALFEYIAAFSVFAIIISLVELIAGVLGVKKSGVPKSAKPCIVFGVMLILITIVNIIYGMIVNTAEFNFSAVMSNLFSCISGLIVPILYLIGAYKNIKD